jgi:hypothetical protein
MHFCLRVHGRVDDLSSLLKTMMFVTEPRWFLKCVFQNRFAVPSWHAAANPETEVGLFGAD